MKVVVFNVGSDIFLVINIQPLICSLIENLQNSIFKEFSKIDENAQALIDQRLLSHRVRY